MDFSKVMGLAMVGARDRLKAKAQSGSGHRRSDYFFFAGCVLEIPPLRLGAAAMTFSFTFFGLRASLEPRDFSPIGPSLCKLSLILAQMLQASPINSSQRTWSGAF
ncbi:hypothetical protein LUX29_13065 [Aureimonas altamirensis]|uniref:hypothetical protein n=1 Tax=Aureimonas altamirensis TaxID=370622 RepID=UPI001E47393F|nr:hypothetical protein [Aureimonas altamirensis]UHD44009.1 hypothetical protein LUX29_13065 [Aureimonas altamirensis]